MTNFEKIAALCAADDMAAVAELLGAVGDLADCVLDYENEADEAAWWLNREASDDDWK